MGLLTAYLCLKAFAIILKQTPIYILVGFLFWLYVTISIQRFKCPKMTDTELFLKIPSAFILDFEECNN